MKRAISRFELARLSYYKRNPLERKALALVREIYGEEQGPILATLLFAREPILFDPCELLEIYEQARIMADHGGAYAEVGVFRGASAKVICEAKGQVPIHLFDTFTGLPDEVTKCDSGFKRGMFAASEHDLRRRLLEYPKVSIHPGMFPETATAVQDTKFSFVHLDVDLYSVTKKALEFFYPRMLQGGRILSHDYGQCEGVWRAFDEFAAATRTRLQPLEMTQVLLIKK